MPNTSPSANGSPYTLPTMGVGLNRVVRHGLAPLLLIAQVGPGTEWPGRPQGAHVLVDVRAGTSARCMGRIARPTCSFRPLASLRHCPHSFHPRRAPLPSRRHPPASPLRPRSCLTAGRGRHSLRPFGYDSARRPRGLPDGGGPRHRHKHLPCGRGWRLPEHSGDVSACLVYLA